ncbi:putative effector protein/endonuclease [Ceratobasidium theobromae]|uniref:Putative effector protein/endonuclease n=1 Tax=Ceratobasidium theobromae TaxID=1582974 RepID=A0A5N5QA56_9AGAM|nr:putative effector protein/endonuclease [Ceratobasidium theobromae]
MFRISSLLLLVVSVFCFHLVHGAPQLLPRFNWGKGAMWGSEEHGTWFDDSGDLKTFGNPRLISVTLRGGDRLDAISYTVTDDSKIRAVNYHHGGGGGSELKFDFAANEYVTSVTVCTGRTGRPGAKHTRISGIQIFTNIANHGIGVGSLGGSSCVNHPLEANKRLIGFFGRQGDEIDAVGLVFKYV